MMKHSTTEEILSSQYQHQCKLLNLISIPYIGVYSPGYEFMIPILALSKPQINEVSDLNLPNCLKYALSEFTSSTTDVPIEYFLISVDGSFVVEESNLSCNSSEMKRLNLVIHPYLFYNLTSLNKDHTSKVSNMLYKNDNFDYIAETRENVSLTFK